jgi:CheY-like chemotaxis protein
MPGGIGGLELARAIRRQWPAMPVVLATGYAERTEALQKEFPMLRKPFSSIELIRMVEAAVRRAHGCAAPRPG